MSRNADRPVSSLPRCSKIVNSSRILEGLEQRNPSRVLGTCTRLSTPYSYTNTHICTDKIHYTPHTLGITVSLPGVGVSSRVCRLVQRNGSLGESGKPCHGQHYCESVMQRDGEFFIHGWGKWLKLKLTKRFSRDETGKQTPKTRCVENWRCNGNLDTRFTGWAVFLSVWLLVQCV